MKHVNYLSFFLLTLFSISFISCSDDDDNKPKIRNYHPIHD